LVKQYMVWTHNHLVFVLLQDLVVLPFLQNIMQDFTLLNFYLALPLTFNIKCSFSNNVIIMYWLHAVPLL
jgi:hypothetical protein